MTPDLTGARHSSQNPQGEGRRTWRPGTGLVQCKHGRPLDRKTQWSQSSGDPAGVGLHRGRQVLLTSSSHWARPRCPLSPPLWPSRPCRSKNTQSGLLAPLDLGCPPLFCQLPPPFTSPRGPLTPGVSPEHKSSSTSSPGPSSSSGSMKMEQMLNGCRENWPCTRAAPSRDLRLEKPSPRSGAQNSPAQGLNGLSSSFSGIQESVQARRETPKASRKLRHNLDVYHPQTQRTAGRVPGSAVGP